MGYAYVEHQGQQNSGLYLSFISCGAGKFLELLSETLRFHRLFLKTSRAIGSFIFFIVTAVLVSEDFYVDLDKVNLLDELKSQFPIINISYPPFQIESSNLPDLETFWFYKAGLLRLQSKTRLLNTVLAEAEKVGTNLGRCLVGDSTDRRFYRAHF